MDDDKREQAEGGGRAEGRRRQGLQLKSTGEGRDVDHTEL
jgi:hypothetical protein